MNVSEEYLDVYERELRLRLAEQPGYSKRRLREAAKAIANQAVPEGHECADVYMKAIFNGDTTTRATYPGEVGYNIVRGLRRISKAVLSGHVDNAPAPRFQTPSMVAGTEKIAAAKRTISDMAAAWISPADGQQKVVRHNKRPTAIQRENLVTQYCEWAMAHDTIPSEHLLGYFTEWGRGTWYNIRMQAVARGFAFKAVGRSHVVKVLSRPRILNGAISADKIADHDEAMVRRILKLMREGKS